MAPEGGSYAGGLGTRREARERAFTLLYEAEAKSTDALEVCASLPVAPEPFTTELLEGVTSRAAGLDAAIAERSVDWPLERMPAVDRALLRLAAFELLYRPDIPDAVSINEAVELAKRFSTDDSGRFVNGVLSALSRGRGSDDGPASPGGGPAGGC